MEENNETTKPKKKGGKIKIICIIVLIVAIIVAAVAAVLTATGKINFSKKSKMVAGVEKLGESVTDPLDKITKAIEKNGNAPKITENLKDVSELEAKMDISVDIDEITIPSLSSSEKSTLKSVTELLNSSEVGMEFRVTEKDGIYGKIGGKLDSTDLSGEALFDGEDLFFRSEDINEKWLMLKGKDLKDMLKESGIDLDNIKETSEKSTETLNKLVDATDIDEKTRKEIKERYKDVIKDYVNDKSKDIKKDKGTITVDGKTKNCQKLTLKLKDTDIKKILNKYVDTFGKDKQVKEILTDVMDVYADLAKDMGQDDVAEEIKNSIDQIYDNIDDLKEAIDELSFDGDVTLVVYADSFRVYRTDVQINVADNATIKLETTFNKNKTVMNIAVKAQGASMNVGKITLESKDNEIKVKGELDKDIAAFIGGQYSFELTYKTEKSKETLSLFVDAGEYGKGTIDFVNEIAKNEDKEYSDKTTISFDIDMDNIATIKMDLIMNTTIKVGEAAIPSVNSADSVDITDENAMKEYQETAQKNLEKLQEKLKSIKALEPLMEEVTEKVESTKTEVNTFDDDFFNDELDNMDDFDIPDMNFDFSDYLDEAV